jgi:histidine triad (HIT) family protein
MTTADCLFCKIASGEINADIVFESDDVLAFRDINPQAPTHVLVIPKRHISTINEMAEADAEAVGLLYLAARDIARQDGIDEAGYRAVMNCNEAAGQTVFHIHLHVLGGRNLSWPPG